MGHVISRIQKITKFHPGVSVVILEDGLKYLSFSEVVAWKKLGSNYGDKGGICSGAHVYFPFDNGCWAQALLATNDEEIIASYFNEFGLSSKYPKYGQMQNYLRFYSMPCGAKAG